MIKSFRKIITTLLIGSALFSSGTAFGKVTKYKLRMDTTQENLEYFYCTATKIEPTYPGDIILMSNFVQMVSGFWPDGNRIIGADELNKVYFAAYHDTNLPEFKNKHGYVALMAGTYDIKCEPGKGEGTGPNGSNRILIDKNFG